MYRSLKTSVSVTCLSVCTGSVLLYVMAMSLKQQPNNQKSNYHQQKNKHTITTCPSCLFECLLFLHSPVYRYFLTSYLDRKDEENIHLEQYQYIVQYLWSKRNYSHASRHVRVYPDILMFSRSMYSVLIS